LLVESFLAGQARPLALGPLGVPLCLHGRDGFLCATPVLVAAGRRFRVIPFMQDGAGLALLGLDLAVTPPDPLPLVPVPRQQLPRREELRRRAGRAGVALPPAPVSRGHDQFAGHLTVCRRRCWSRRACGPGTGPVCLSRCALAGGRADAAISPVRA